MRNLPLSEFELTYWLNGRDTYEGVPDRVDKYSPGHLTWGKNVDRGLAIQRGRGAKALKKNLEFFFETVFPSIKDRLTPLQIKYIARDAPDHDAVMVEAGWTKWENDSKQIAWVHPIETPDHYAEVNRRIGEDGLKQVIPAL